MASFAKGMSSLHFYLIAEMLVNLGFEWCIFTATDPLHAMMARLGLEPHIIAQADQNKVPDAGVHLGVVLRTSTACVSWQFAKGLERLRLVQERKRKQA